LGWAEGAEPLVVARAEQGAWLQPAGRWKMTRLSRSWGDRELRRWEAEARRLWKNLKIFKVIIDILLFDDFNQNSNVPKTIENH
jgi:hypothetical protein